MTDQPSLDEILAQARAMAEESQAWLKAHQAKCPAVIPTAPDVTQAHAKAERLQKPVRTMSNGHPVTVWPIGKVPALAPDTATG